MKNIKDIASGGKYVPWETLAGSIDDNFTELNNNKLGSGDLAQGTGTSTTKPMSQKAVTDALELSVGTPTYTNYLTCSTASGTANKTVNILGFSVNNKVRLLIKMTYATTVDANLAISAPITVTKPLYYNGQRAGASNTWKAGAVLDIYYDGTNFQATDFISQGGSGGSDKVVHVWCTGDFYLADLDPVFVEEDKDIVEIEDILGIKPKQLYDYALDSTVIIHDTPSAQTGSSTKFGCVVLNYSLCDLGGKGTVEENPGITNSDYIELTYTIGSKVYNYKLWFDKAENIYTGITDAHVTDLESGICLINNLLATISDTDSKKTVTKENVESWFGSSSWRDIYYRIKGKVLADYSFDSYTNAIYTVLLTYMILGDLWSGTEGYFIILTYQNDKAISIVLIFQNGEFISGSCTFNTLITDAPKNGKSYVRKNGDWVEYTELKQEKICYYKTTKNDAVESEYYNTSKFPGDILGGTSSGDFQIVRFTVAPGKAHTGPSFMLYDGDYNYYAKWDAFGIYPSSDDYFSSGSGYVPKANVAFSKAASTEQVVYVASTNKFQQISW